MTSAQNRTIARWRYLTSTTRIHFGFALLFKFYQSRWGLKNNSLNLHKNTTNSSKMTSSCNCPIDLLTEISSWRNPFQCSFDQMQRTLDQCSVLLLIWWSKSENRALFFVLFQAPKAAPRIKPGKQWKYFWQCIIVWHSPIKARFKRRTFHEPNLIRIKAYSNYLDRLNWFRRWS